MFDTLAEKLQAAFAKLRGNAKLTEADVDVALREVRLALLEADVNFKVVKEFVGRVKERAIGEQILEGLNPAQQVVKVVRDEMIRLLAGEDPETAESGLESAASGLTFAAKPPTVIMLCGLQGAGKTTLAGKLANHLRKQGKTPVLAACDVQRPAAIKQLQVVGEQVKTAVFTVPQADPVRIAREAVDWAKANRADVVILDTAGRLHVDDALMDELRGVRDTTQPHEVLLVLDSMTGQDAVNVAQQFNEAIGVDGFVLTKIDGDTRGGAAISVRAVVGKPIKFVGVGEKMDALEVFYPDRMASRILGMGDVLSLIEKAEAAVDEKKAAEMEKKLKSGKFDFEDFLDQMQQMRKLGPLEKLLELLPGVGGMTKEIDFAAGEKEMAKFEAIVRSMTVRERRNPELLNGSRRKRIAQGAGVTVQEINEAVKKFDQMRDMMKMFATGKMPGMGRMGPMMPGAMGHGGQIAKRKKKGGGGGGGGQNRFRLPFGR
jgi:signal recognition particle subunit SRP54